MNKKLFIAAIINIVILSTFVIALKSIRSDENKHDVNSMISLFTNPISFTYDYFSSLFPEYGNRDRAHKMWQEYHEQEAAKIAAPLKRFKENNNTQEHASLLEGYEHRAFEIAKNGGDLHKLSALIASGVDVNSRDEKGRTLFFYAAATKNAYAMRSLIGEGADITLQDNLGIRPIDLIDQYKEPQLYEVFTIESDIATAKSQGYTNVAISYSYDANNRLLSKSVQGEQKASWSPLMVAIDQKDTQTALTLIDSGAKLNAVTNNGSTPLFFAIKYQNNAVVDTLLEHGSDIEHQNKFQMNPLALAIKLDNLYAVKALVKAGVNTHSICASSRTPVKYAEVNRRDEIMQYLKSIGAS